MSLLQKVNERLHIMNSLMWSANSTRPAMEIVYRELFLRDLAKLGLEDRYYPVGWAANHGLLYLVARCFTELPVGQVLELGAGQSSILLSQLNDRLKRQAVITTVEHGTQWADRIQGQVSHRVTVADLVPKTIEGHRIRHYGGAYFDPSVRYDFVLVDGPPANKGDDVLNRLGAVELLANNLAESFVLIVDDAERRGEDMLVGSIRRRLQKNDRDFKETAIMAAKRQHVFAAGSCSSAVFF